MASRVTHDDLLALHNHGMSWLRVDGVHKGSRRMDTPVYDGDGSKRPLDWMKILRQTHKLMS
ncbi:hypothetical protein T4D_15165 [Trichinella pseudospiralis]|uniref:Uncharacterized protein n=1 Tax=Trichinella pseudospiralis TaxID=6337 RepID=A0A0V1F6Q3_TRIPS|nr:hypothetical protein T4D_15165 [Trichinella pseudospiralis]